MDRLVPDQLALFESQRSGPEGLRFAADFISPAIEQKLILGVQGLPLQPFQFGQFEGKRRVTSFGFRYDYALRQLQAADPLPSWLVEIVAEVEIDVHLGGRVVLIYPVIGRSRLCMWQCDWGHWSDCWSGSRW